MSYHAGFFIVKYKSPNFKNGYLVKKIVVDQKNSNYKFLSSNCVTPSSTPMNLRLKITLNIFSYSYLKKIKKHKPLALSENVIFSALTGYNL